MRQFKRFKCGLRMMVVMLLGAGLPTLLWGCNTTRGAGQDVEKLGESVKNSAENHGADH